MNLTKLRSWKTKLLDGRSSGAATAENCHGVADYAAEIAYEPASEAYSETERKFLLDLARRTVGDVVTNGMLPRMRGQTVSDRLKEIRACFVTLTKRGQLRGCVGHIIPQAPLYCAVMDNARSAAVRDTRFPPVEPVELGELRFEISVLSEPRPLEFVSPDELLAQLHPPDDGVVLGFGGRSSTFLPQVWRHLPDKVDFLNHLAVKAGGDPWDWRKPGTTVSIYRVEAFAQPGLE